ncbi:MAG: hypothetical protein U5L01_03820 [Rheinheimera sp.]|nr:hypothetical protein [Rheinheimera sp.]
MQSLYRHLQNGAFIIGKVLDSRGKACGEISSVNLRFIRQYSAFDTCWQFAMKTDVWVFSDLDGLLYLKKSIRKAIKAKNNIHLDEVETDSVSMQCVILPALKNLRLNQG